MIANQYLDAPFIIVGKRKLNEIPMDVSIVKLFWLAVFA